MPTPRTPLRPPPGQTSLAARLAAPDQADQVEGTHQRGYFMFAVLMFLMTACVLAVGLMEFDCELGLRHGFVNRSCCMVGRCDQ
ncbi:hypothetical protein DelCs14_3913 [Delftia sp. Cs1-4]|nr:hypothetical protein DelCs14_3913 [Delftia sp. Cs1-4]